jgi:hypothetical protein
MDKYQRHTEEALKLYQDGYSQRQICKLLTQLHGSKFDQSHLGKALRNHPGYKPRAFQGGDNISNQKPMPDWYREDKIEKQIAENGLTVGAGVDWKHAWLKDKNGASIFVRNTSEIIGFDEMRKEFIADMESYAPKYDKHIRKPITDKHLLIIDPSDIHVNKLSTKEETGEEYNSEIAVNRVKDAIEGVLQKASGFPLDKIILILGNDCLNTDGITNATTKGTTQDVSHRWYEGFRLAKQMYVDVIESLMQEADVEVVHVMSNHDYVSGWMLADSVYSWFRNCKNVTFNLEVRHRKYLKWGNNLIGLSHGDKFKAMDAPLLMANEAPQYWAETYYRYFLLHHIHHHTKTKFQSGKDYQGVTVQHLRSPSPADLWHFDSGFTHAKQAIEAFIHHETDGQVCCITHNF